jgi:predicted Zn-dependent protease
VADDNSGFVAYAHHPQLGEEAVPGRIVFDRWQVRFESSAATLEIPLARVEIEIVEEAETTTIYFRHPDHSEWSLHTFDTAILEHRQLRQQANTRHQLRAYHSQDDVKRRLIITFAVIGGFALLAVLASLLTGVMVRSLVARIPPKYEKELGDKVMAELKQEVTFVVDPKMLARLDKGVLPLLVVLPTNQVQFQFYLLDHPLPNAFALPGGHVVVTTALLEMADRPEQIAGVVAHEIAHVTLKHGFRKIVSTAGPYLVCKLFLGDRGGLVGVLGAGSQMLVSQGFSQDYELEADAQGFDYLVGAHIDPRSLPDMLRKLQLQYDRMQGTYHPNGAFSSHPSTEKRIRRLEEKWDHLKDKSNFTALERWEIREKK